MECTDGTCKIESIEPCTCGSSKSYEQCCGCDTVDPVEHAMMAWHKAFFAAHNDAMAERMRKRIETSYGPVMDKAADAVFEAIGKVWSSMLTQSEAKKEVASKLQKIFSEANKR